MKTIKKYWMIIVAGIAAVFGIFAITSKQRNVKKANKLQKQIDDNKVTVDKIEGKTEIINQQREEIKQEIKQQEQKIERLEEKKQEIKPEVRKVSDAKENILNKTSRGRKPKKK
jgi:TolA-binding protein